MEEQTIEEVAEKFIKAQEYVSLEQDDIIFEAIMLGYKFQLNKSI